MILGISDRYIIRSFIFSLVVCSVSLVSIFVVIDTFSNFSNIVDTWRHSGKPASYLVLMIIEMNAVRMPLIFAELGPVLTLAAAMFTVVRLRKANEITPLLASGTSIYRVLFPVFLMAIVLTVAQIADKELLIPRFGDRIYQWDRVRNENLAKWRRQAMMEDGYGNVLFAGRYDLASKIQYAAQITRYWRTAGTRTPMVIVNAQEAHWVESPRRGWLYLRGTVIEYDLSGNVVAQTGFGDQGKLVALDQSRQAPNNRELCTDATPERLETDEVDIMYRPTLDLLEYTHEHGLRSDIALDINRRLAAPLTNLVLLLVGLPLVLKRDMKSPFLGAALAVLITAAYYALGLVCENFALQGRFLSPLTGAWAPIIVFGPIGVLLFDTVES